MTISLKPGAYFVLIFLLLVGTFSCKKEESSSPVTLVELSAADLTVAEQDVNTDAVVVVRLSRAAEQEILVSYATENSTAQAGTDYLQVNGTLNFQPGEQEKEIVVEIIGDVFKENEELFFVNFTNGINVSLKTKQLTVVITDEDVQEPTSEINIPTTGYTTPSSYTGYSLTWQDEFNGTELSSDWSYEIGDGCPNLCGWGNNELQYYRKENTSLQDGYLVIEAKKEPFGGKAYTSSRIITQGNQSVQYGRIDIRAALPEGQGVWPALWMLGSNISTVGWPACGEIDIMEKIGGAGNEKTVYGTVHWQDGGGQRALYTGEYTISSGSLKNEFFVYSIIWEEQTIAWYINDIKYHEIDTSPAELDEFRKDFFFIFNVAVGGDWPGNPDTSTIFPQQMIVDYIRVFTKN